MAAMAVEMVGGLATAELPDKGGRPKLAFVGVDNTTGLPVDNEVIAESIVAALVRSGRFRVLDRETVKAQLGDSLGGPAATTSEEAAARLGRIVTATFFLEAYVTGVQVTASGTSRAAAALAFYLVDVDEARQAWSAERVLSRPGRAGDSLR
jgi:TolB-like protein